MLQKIYKNNFKFKTEQTKEEELRKTKNQFLRKIGTMLTYVNPQ